MVTVDVKDLLIEQQAVWKALKEEVQRLETSGKHAQKEWSEKLQTLNNRLDEIETSLKRPVAAGTDLKATSPASETDRRYTQAFEQYMRKGGAFEMELKALSSDTDTTGGYLLPRNVSDKITLKLIQRSPIRELVGVVQISSGDLYEEPKEGAANFAAAWVAERGSRTETAEATLRMEKTPVHELYANPFVTQKMLDDNVFNLEQWMTERIAWMFAVAEGAAFINGTGVGQPEGLLTNGELTGSYFVKTNNASTLTADGLIGLYYSLPQFYAKEAVWVMNRATLQIIRTLKDSNGQYLWSPGFSGALSQPQPDSVLGRPYFEAVDMPLVGAGAYPIIFGNLKLGYRVVDRIDIRVLRDPYSNKPYIAFYTTKRVGGQVILAEAMRVQLVSA